MNEAVHRRCWIVAFGDPEIPLPWWARARDRAFRHVIAFSQARPGDDDSGVLVVNSMGSRLAVDVRPTSIGLFARYFVAKGWRVLVYETAAPERAALRPGLIHCVEIVKAIIGCASWRVITARQLHAWLLRHGAAPLQLQGA